MGAANNADPGTTGEGRVMIRHRSNTSPPHPSRMRSRRSPGPVTRARSRRRPVPAAGPAHAAQRTGRSSTSGAWRAPRHPEDGDTIVIGAMTTHDEVANSGAGQRSMRPCSPGHGRGGRPADPSPGTLGGAIVHADPAGDLGARCSRSTPRWSSPGPAASARSRQGLLHRPLQDGRGRRGTAHRDPDPQSTGWGAHYEKFVRVAPVVDRRRGSHREGRRRHDQRGQIGLSPTWARRPSSRFGRSRVGRKVGQRRRRCVLLGRRRDESAERPQR